MTKAKSRPRVTYDVDSTDWVHLEIWGEETENYGWREDGGLTTRFMQWLMKEKIASRTQRTGGGAWVGRVPRTSIDRVMAWLRENGAVAK